VSFHGSDKLNIIVEVMNRMSSEEVEDNLFYDAEEGEGNMQIDGINSTYFENNSSNMNYSNKITAENIKRTNSNYNPRGYDNSTTVNRYSESSKRNVSNLTGLYFSPDEDIGTSRGVQTRRNIQKLIFMYT
jgi:hypothetical protein